MMRLKFDPLLVRALCLVYRAMQWIYPRNFRREFGPQMLQVFRTRVREVLPGRKRLLPVRCFHLGKDLVISAAREWGSLIGITGLAAAIAAAGLAALAAYVDFHNTEPQPAALVILAGTFCLGLARPRATWVWALVLGGGFVLAQFPIAWLGLHPLDSFPNHHWYERMIALIPAFIGAYAGALARFAARPAVP